MNVKPKSFTLEQLKPPPPPRGPEAFCQVCKEALTQNRMSGASPTCGRTTCEDIDKPRRARLARWWEKP